MNSDVKTWTVIKFSDNSVEAVPTGWIMGNLCYWPPFSREKLLNAIRKSEKVNTCWPSFQMELFKNATYDDDMSARHKARKAEDTSDLNSNSASEGFEARRIRSRKHTFSPCSSDSPSDEESVLPHPPKIQKTISKPVDHAKSSKMIELESISPTSRTTVEKIQTPCSSLERKRDSLDNIHEPRNENSPSFLGTPRSTLPTIGRCNHRCPHCCMPGTQDKSLKQIVSQNHMLRSLVAEVLNEIQNVKEIMKNYVSTEKEKEESNSIFLKYPDIHFPIDTFDDVEKFDLIMKNENELSAAINELSKYGGKSTYDFVKRALTLLITNNLAKQYSFYGRKGKKAFHLSTLSNIVIGAAQKAGISKDYKSTEASIQSWLKRSSERMSAALNKN